MKNSVSDPGTLHLRAERSTQRWAIKDAHISLVHSLTGDEPGAIEELPRSRPAGLLELGHYRP